MQYKLLTVIDVTPTPSATTMQLKNLVFANVLFMVIFSEITEMKYVKDRCSHSTAKS